MGWLGPCSILYIGCGILHPSLACRFHKFFNRPNILGPFWIMWTILIFLSTSPRCASLGMWSMDSLPLSRGGIILLSLMEPSLTSSLKCPLDSSNYFFFWGAYNHSYNVLCLCEMRNILYGLFLGWPLDLVISFHASNSLSQRHMEW